MLFEVEGIQREKRVKRKFEAETQKELISILKEIDFIPIKITPLVKKSMPFFSGISFNDITNFTRQMAMMLNAGLSIVDSFAILKRQANKEALIKLYQDIDKEIKSGKSFSKALEKHEGYFPSIYISLVKAGEASGKLAEIMLRLADNLEASQEFRGRLKSALIYPVIVISTMIVVGFIMVTFVVPRLLEIYKNFQMDLPFTTQLLMNISEISRKYWYYIIGYVFLVIFLIRKYLQTEHGKYSFDSLLLRLPGFGPVIAKGVLVESTRTLAILTRSGVSILEALAIVIDTTNNLVFRRAFESIYDQVKKGVSLGEAMEREEIFPPMLVQMVKVGESTGHLDDTLERVSRFFEMESNLAIKALTSLIEPAILIILALGVFFLVTAVITPIYNLTSAF